MIMFIQENDELDAISNDQINKNDLTILNEYCIKEEKILFTTYDKNDYVEAMEIIKQWDEYRIFPVSFKVNKDDKIQDYKEITDYKSLKDVFEVFFNFNSYGITSIDEDSLRQLVTLIIKTEDAFIFDSINNSENNDNIGKFQYETRLIDGIKLRANCSSFDYYIEIELVVLLEDNKDFNEVILKVSDANIFSELTKEEIQEYLLENIGRIIKDNVMTDAE